MMKYQKATLQLLIIVWIIFASLTVLYNAAKTIPEIREWAHLSEMRKRQKIFGSAHTFSEFINNNTTSNARILFYTEEGMPYFYARYYSYPRRLYWHQNTETYVKNTYPKQFDYVALFNMHASFKDYKKVASFSSDDTDAFGSLYKRK